MKSAYLFLILLLISSAAAGFEVPKDFEGTNTFGAKSDFWIHPKTLETIGLADEDVSSLEPSKDDYAEIREVMNAKASVLPAILKIKNYKISSSKEIKSKNGKVILFFGSYTDSSDDHTTFAEVYLIPNTGKPSAYLLTRPKTEWTEAEVIKRFKAEL